MIIQLSFNLTVIYCTSYIVHLLFYFNCPLNLPVSYILCFILLLPVLFNLYSLSG